MSPTLSISKELMVWTDPLELFALKVDLTVPSDDANDKDDTLKICVVDDVTEWDFPEAII